MQVSRLASGDCRRSVALPKDCNLGQGFFVYKNSSGVELAPPAYVPIAIQLTFLPKVVAAIGVASPLAVGFHVLIRIEPAAGAPA